MLRQCCECRRIWVDDRWVYPLAHQIQGRDISHGYCDQCFSRFIEKIHMNRTPSSRPHRPWFRRLIQYFH